MGLVPGERSSIGERSRIAAARPRLFQEPAATNGMDGNQWDGRQDQPVLALPSGGPHAGSSASPKTPRSPVISRTRWTESVGEMSFKSCPSALRSDFT